MGPEERYWIWLASIPGIGPNRFYTLLNTLGSAQNVWDALTSTQYSFVDGIGQQLWDVLRRYRNEQYLEALLINIEKNDVKVLLSSSPEYPVNLANIYNPPPVLYVKGYIDNAVDTLAVAVVGTRHCSVYGRMVAQKICSQLASAGINIVSGMARGIDGLAHKAAIEVGGRTVAVLGSGVDVIYPPEHKLLYHQIIENGAIVSEYSLGTQPLKGNFPQRNRIISGLALGVLIIEAGPSSGALITADFALEQGREVFAIPGNITATTSIGTNALIKQGAKLVTCVEDILEELNIPVFNTDINTQQNNDVQLTVEEQRLISYFEDQPLTTEKLCILSGLDVATINRLLTSLEIKGIIKQLPGTIFIKIV